MTKRTESSPDEGEAVEPRLDLQSLDRFIDAQRRLLGDTFEPDDTSEDRAHRGESEPRRADDDARAR